MLPSDKVQVGVFEIGRHVLGLDLGPALADDAYLHPVAAADGAADDMLLFQGGQFSAGNAPFPDHTVQFLEQVFRSGFAQETSFVDQRDARGGGFHIRDNVRGQDDDAFSR